MGSSSSKSKETIYNHKSKSTEIRTNKNSHSNHSNDQPSENIAIPMTPPTNSNRVPLNSIGGSFYKDIREVYTFKEILGGGKFGTCRVASKLHDKSGRLYAIKSIAKNHLDPKELDKLIWEVEILSGLNHPNIIKFYETYHDEFYFHIVMELCLGKELFDKIVDNNSITEEKVSIITHKVISAISYCHSKGISHRDLKPENIMFETPDPDAEIKLIDFGFSKKYNLDEKMQTILGTPYYISPEVLRGEYDEKCDVWSIGAICYVMLCGEPPFKGNSNMQIFYRVLNDELKFDKEKWGNISEDAKDFIRKCMVKQSEYRFSAREALDHPWFRNIIMDVHSKEKLSVDLLMNLKNCSYTHTLKSLVMRHLIKLLDEQELKKLKDAFYAIDIDHTGHINIDELEKAFTIAGIKVTKDEIQKIMDAADETRNFKLDYTEFVLACVNQKKFLDKEKLIYAFKYFDVDNSGYICSSDLKNAMLRSGKKVLDNEQIDHIIDQVVSHKKDKKISLKEFLNIFDCSIEN